MEQKDVLETNRLILRRYEQKDVQDSYEYLSNPKVVQYEPYKPMTMEEVKGTVEWRMTSDEFIAVEEKSSHKMIGNVYLGKREFNTLELGYVFNEEYWGRGFAKESCQKLIEDAFSKGIHRVYSECNPENPNSWRLLERLGFVREACFKSNVYFWTDEKNEPIWIDTYVYSRINPMK